MISQERYCGYTVERDGEQEPCDRPATGHRWYQDHEHEDTLDVACDLHRNEGGDRLAAAESKVAATTAALREWCLNDGGAVELMEAMGEALGLSGASRAP